MRRYVTYRGFTLADDRFYEDIEHFIPDGDFERLVSVLAGDEVRTQRRGPWINCNPVDVELPAHGWKIHVSATPLSAQRALSVVLDEFARQRFAFKCLRDTDLVVSATSRWWQAGQVGKFITIYTRSAAECLRMLERLYPLMEGVAGPYVLTDRRYRDSASLYYRYGGFTNVTRTEPDGSMSSILIGPSGEVWEDDRKPAYRKPPWVPELIELPAAEPPSRIIRGYAIQRALHFTGAGGLYLAERISDGAQVVLKESRPHTAFSSSGVSGQDRLRREYEALQRVDGTGTGPAPFELFEEWEHLYLAEEYLAFGPLTSFVAARSPAAHGDLSPEALELYRTQIKTVLANLRHAIERCHERGMGYGDLSANNILINPEDLSVRLVDFESSQPLGDWKGDNPATPGFRPPQGSREWADPRAFDHFGLDAAELAMISSRNVLRDLNPAALSRSTRHAAAILGYPLGDLLERLNLPTEQAAPADIDFVVKETIRFAENTLTPQRSERPFPSSPEIFGTSPWSVAHGAAGMLRGLHQLTGQVHPALAEWMSLNQAQLQTLPPSLYYGLAGVGWTLLDAGQPDQGTELIARAGEADPASMPASILDGAAGIGMAHLAMWAKSKDSKSLRDAMRIGKHLLSTCKDSGTGLYWARPGTASNPLGYGYGSSGIALFLLYLHLATGEDRYLRIGRQALEFEVSQLAPRASSGIGLPGHAGKPLLEPYWERGSAGFGGVLTRYCKVTPDAHLRTILDQLVTCTLRGNAIFPGLFSGTAGLVNFALDYEHLLGQNGIAQGMMSADLLTLACQEPEGIAFPGHGLLRYSNDFATGGIGIALVLNRLAHGGPDFNYTLDELLDAGAGHA